jgi:hypothetical protein
LDERDSRTHVSSQDTCTLLLQLNARPLHGTMSAMSLLRRCVSLMSLDLSDAMPLTRGATVCMHSCLYPRPWRLSTRYSRYQRTPSTGLHRVMAKSTAAAEHASISPTALLFQVSFHTLPSHVSETTTSSWTTYLQPPASRCLERRPKR